MGFTEHISLWSLLFIRRIYTLKNLVLLMPGWFRFLINQYFLKLRPDNVAICFCIKRHLNDCCPSGFVEELSLMQSSSQLCASVACWCVFVTSVFLLHLFDFCVLTPGIGRVSYGAFLGRCAACECLRSFTHPSLNNHVTCFLQSPFSVVCMIFIHTCVCVCVFIFTHQFICFTVEILTLLCIKSSI